MSFVVAPWHRNWAAVVVHCYSWAALVVGQSRLVEPWASWMKEVVELYNRLVVVVVVVVVSP